MPQWCQGPFLEQEERWDFSRDAAVEKGLSSLGGETLLVFLKLRRGSSRCTTGISGTACGVSGRSSLHASPEGPLWIPLQSLPGSLFSSGVEAASSGFLSRADMNLGVPLGRPHGSQGLVSCEAMQIRSPLEPEMQGQSSCRFDHRDW